MTKLPKQMAEYCKGAAMRCLYTTLGFEESPFFTLRITVKGLPMNDGAMIGINFGKCPPELKKEVIALANKIDALKDSA
jgi:hypothetical protein